MGNFNCRQCGIIIVVAQQMHDTFPQTVKAQEELTRSSPTTLHPCGTRHPLRGFLSKTPTCLRGFSTSSRSNMGRMIFIVP
jgi:hypothetical protein